MDRLCRLLILAVGVGLAGAAASGGTKKAGPARVDLHGDPRPAGALARLGTVYFRSDGQGFALSPDGKTLALNHGNVIRLCEVPSGKELRQLKKGQEPLGIIGFSPNGQTLATRGKGTLTLWNVPTGKELWELRGVEGDSPKGVFTADSKRFVSWGSGGKVRLWEAASGKLLRQFTQPANSCWAVSPEGTLLAGLVDKYTLRLWNVATGKIVRTLSRQKSPVFWVMFAPGSKTLASVNQARKPIRLWDVATGKEKDIPLWRPIDTRSLKFSASGKVLVGTYEDEDPIHIWDVTTGNYRRTLKCEPRRKWFDLSPDGKTVAVNAYSFVDLWEVATAKGRGRLEGSIRVTDSEGPKPSFSADSRLLLARDGRAVRLWNVATGDELPTSQGHPDYVTYLGFSPDGRVVETRGLGDPQLWDASTGNRLLPRRDRLAPAVYRVYSPDGDFLVANQIKEVTVADLRTKRFSSHLTLRDTATGKEGKVLKLKGLFGGFTFSPDGKTLAISETLYNLYNYGRKPIPLVECWDVTTGQLRFTLPIKAHLDMVFSSDGKLLAVQEDRTIALWEMATQTQVYKFPQSSRFAGLTRTRSGRLLVAECQARLPAVIVWDVLTGESLERLRMPETDHVTMAFSADGSKLATAMADTSVLVWDLRGPITAIPSGPARLTVRELDRLWDELAATDAGQGFRAVRTLLRAPKQAFALLKKRLRAATPGEVQRLVQLIRDLDSSRFVTRKKATDELKKYQERAWPALKKAMAGKPTLEARLRMEALMKDSDGPIRTPEVLRELRAVQVLEYIDSRGGRLLLGELSRGAPDAWLTDEAQAACNRLAQRTVKSRQATRP